MTDFLSLSGDERDVIAGEYVLGTLDQQTSEQVEAAMARDPNWAAAVAAWEARLRGLVDLAPPEAPPPQLWTAVEAALWPTDALKRARFWQATRIWRATRFWQSWAIGASFVVAALAVFALLPRQTAPQMLAVLVADANQPAFMAQVDASGGLRLAAATSAGGVRPNAAAGRSLELWGLPPGATAPRSLGVLPKDPGIFRVAAGQLRAVPDMLIMISQEPEGGSPTGQPTGPVVFYGRLIAVPEPAHW